MIICKSTVAAIELTRWLNKHLHWPNWEVANISLERKSFGALQAGMLRQLCVCAKSIFNSWGLRSPLHLHTNVLRRQWEHLERTYTVEETKPTCLYWSCRAQEGDGISTDIDVNTLMASTLGHSLTLHLPSLPSMLSKWRPARMGSPLQRPMAELALKASCLQSCNRRLWQLPIIRKRKLYSSSSDQMKATDGTNVSWYAACSHPVHFTELFVLSFPEIWCKCWSRRGRRTLGRSCAAADKIFCLSAAMQSLSLLRGHLWQKSAVHPQPLSRWVSCTRPLSISSVSPAWLLRWMMGWKIILTIKKQEQKYKSTDPACRTSAPLFLLCTWLICQPMTGRQLSRLPCQSCREADTSGQAFEAALAMPWRRLSFCMTIKEPWVRLRFKQSVFWGVQS